MTTLDIIWELSRINPKYKINSSLRDARTIILKNESTCISTFTKN